MRRSGTTFTVEVQPALVRSDRLQLRQVVRNLLSNARKYGGPTVRVLGRLEAGWYEIRVEDDGRGIPKELHDRLFQRYLHKGDLPLVVGSVGLRVIHRPRPLRGDGWRRWYERRSGWTSFVIRVPLAAHTDASPFRGPAIRCRWWQGGAGTGAPGH